MVTPSQVDTASTLPPVSQRLQSLPVHKQSHLHNNRTRVTQLHDSNPFATRFIRPGAIPFHSANNAVNEIGRQLAQQAWRGAIVGPHGVGKSTLLATLESQWALWNRQSFHWQLSRTKLVDLVRLPLTRHTQVIVDGYAQLPWWTRWRLEKWIEAREAGLLVTAHHPPRSLPVTYRCEGSLAATRAIVRHLLASASSPQAISEADLAHHFAASDGNVRETLLRLFDLYRTRTQ